MPKKNYTIKTEMSAKILETLEDLKTMITELRQELAELKGIAEKQQKQQKAAAKKEKDPTMPKRALSSFTFYSNEIRTQVKTDNPKAKFGDISKIIGNKWKTLSDDEKVPYKAKAEEDKGRYIREMETWKTSHSE